MISIVVPTYKEAENLPHLARGVADVLVREALDYELIVVDDDSNDGCEEVCAKLAAEHPNRIIVR